jgi:hypothetical protein
VERTRLVAEQHARVSVRSLADRLHQRPLAVLGLVVALDGAQVAIFCVNAIASIPADLVPNVLAEAAGGHFSRAAADRQRLGGVKWKLSGQRRVERVGAWGAASRWEAETGFERASMASPNGRGCGAAAGSVAVHEAHARSGLIHECKGLFVEALGTRRAYRRGSRALGERDRGRVLRNWQVGVLHEDRARDGLAADTGSSG